MAEAASTNPTTPTHFPISAITHRVFHPPKLERKNTFKDGFCPLLIISYIENRHKLLFTSIYYLSKKPEMILGIIFLRNITKEEN
uniref:Uncharacterized protein n=1 Tax=Strigamia maritima TaxID=126957 RepID=T1IZY1_STRMM